MPVNWKAFVDQIRHYQSFVLTSHIRPDCDALGSELGMAEVLRAVGKEVQIVNAHRTPPPLSFLDPAGRIDVLGDSIEPEAVQADCLMVLDTSAWAQLGDMGDYFGKYLFKKLAINLAFIIDQELRKYVMHRCTRNFPLIKSLQQHPTGFLTIV